jgi:hypothetical protein
MRTVQRTNNHRCDHSKGDRLMAEEKKTPSLASKPIAFGSRVVHHRFDGIRRRAGLKNLLSENRLTG